MSLSRRGFFKGAAATGATIATGGGAPAAARAAVGVATAGAGLAAALTAAERKTRAAVALAKHGGFPVAEIMAALRVYPSRENEADVKAQAAAVLLGEGTPQRFEDGRNAGKIRLHEEYVLFEALRRLPRGAPLRDILSPEMMRDTMRGRKNEERGQYYGMGDHADGSQNLEAFWNIFESYLGEETTVEDLEQKGLAHFEKMARQFLENPKDFADGFDDGARVAGYFRHMLLRQADKSVPSMQELLDTLQERHDRYVKVHGKLLRRESLKEKKRYEAEQKQWNELREKHRLAEQERIAQEQAHRLNTPSARARYDVSILRGERGEYMVEETAFTRILKADWLHFVQEIDPAGAKAKDIEMRAGGLMVAFHNEKVIGALDAFAKKRQKGWIKISLPNRRMGVDLNDPAPDMEI